jgi:hypothetical protein
MRRIQVQSSKPQPKVLPLICTDVEDREVQVLKLGGEFFSALGEEYSYNGRVETIDVIREDAKTRGLLTP